MAKKLRVKQDIGQATEAMKAIMQENLAAISRAMIDQIMAAYRRAPDSQRFTAVNNIKPQGISAYKDALKNALAVIASKSIDSVRKEVPKKKNVRLASIEEDALRLGEYESLPADIRARIDSMLRLLTGTQISDLEKVIFFQFNSSVDSTDSEALLEKDLTDAADEYVGGNAINGGASASAGQIINEARQAFFLDDSVSQEIEAFEFVNGDPVSPICQELAGTVFAKDDPNLQRFYPPLHFNAVLVGSMISTDQGDKPIEQVKVGDTVLTHLGNGCKVYDVMSKFEDKEYFELSLDDGKALCLTGEHPVLTARGWVRADELLMTDEVVCIEDLQNA